MTNHKPNPKIHKSWKYNPKLLFDKLPQEIVQEIDQNIGTENKQKDLENSPKIPEQNSKNLDKNSSLENSHQIITVPFQALAIPQRKTSLSIWQKTQDLLGQRINKFSTGTMAILALILAFSSILGMAFLANSNNNVLKNAQANGTEIVKNLAYNPAPVYNNTNPTQNTGGNTTTATDGKSLPVGTVMKDADGLELVVVERAGERVFVGKDGQNVVKSYQGAPANWPQVFQSMLIVDGCIPTGSGTSLACFTVNGQRVKDLKTCPPGWTTSRGLYRTLYSDLTGIEYYCELHEWDYPEMVKVNTNSGSGVLAVTVPDPNGRNLLVKESAITRLEFIYSECLKSNGIIKAKVEYETLLSLNKDQIAGKQERPTKGKPFTLIKNDYLSRIRKGQYDIVGEMPYETLNIYGTHPNVSCNWPSDYTYTDFGAGEIADYIDEQSGTDTQAVQDSNYKIFEANGAVIKESEFVACKKNSIMSSGATTKFESVICFFPNAQAKRNQIQNKEKNGATLWCPKGWNFADYDNTPASQTGQSCYVGDGTPKYNEYAAKIDAGQIRQELPNIDLSKVEAIAMPDNLKNVQIPSSLSNEVLDRFRMCSRGRNGSEDRAKFPEIQHATVNCGILDDKFVQKDTPCPNGWFKDFRYKDSTDPNDRRFYDCGLDYKTFENFWSIFTIKADRIFGIYDETINSKNLKTGDSGIKFYTDELEWPGYDRKYKTIEFKEPQVLKDTNFTYKGLRYEQLNDGQFRIDITGITSPDKELISCTYRTYDSNIANETYQSAKPQNIMVTSCYMKTDANGVGSVNCNEINSVIYERGLLFKGTAACIFKGDIFGVRYLLPENIQQKIAGFENGNVGLTKEESAPYKTKSGGNNSTNTNNNQNATVPDHLKDETIKRFDECSANKEGWFCAKIDGRKIDKAIDCPIGWKYNGNTTSCYVTGQESLEISGGKIVKKGTNQGNNNDKICAQVLTVGQNVNNRQEIKQFPNSCLPDGFERITDQMVAAVAYRMSECGMEGNNSLVCKKIDGRQVVKNLDCPKGWTGSGGQTAWNWNFGNIKANAADVPRETNNSANSCVLKNSLWGDNLSKLIKLENGLLKDAGSNGNSNDLIGPIDTRKEVSKVKMYEDCKNSGGVIEDTNICQKNDQSKVFIASYNNCEIKDAFVMCQKSTDPATQKTTAPKVAIFKDCPASGGTLIENICRKNDESKAVIASYVDCEIKNALQLCQKISDSVPRPVIDYVSANKRDNPNCNPEKDMDGKMRDLNDQQCKDRINGYTGPFNFQTGGKRGTRNCYYVGSVLNRGYGCDKQGYLIISCDTIGRYASSNPDQDFGAPNCRNTFVAQTQEAQIINLGISDVAKTTIGGVQGVIATDLMDNPRNFTACFEPTQNGAGFQTGNAYCTAGGGITPPSPTAVSWINIGQINVLAIPGDPIPGGVGVGAKPGAGATGLTGPGTGGFDIGGLKLLDIDCLFSRGEDVLAANRTKGCLVDRITNFLITLSYPLALLVLIWAGYQYFIGGVDGKSNGLKAVQAVIAGIVLISGSKIILDTLAQTIPSDGGAFKTAPIIGLITLIKDFFVSLSTLVAILVIVWGGYKFFFSGLDFEKEGGIKAIKNAVIGLAIILIANSLVDTITKIGNDIASNPTTGLTLALDNLIKPMLTNVTSLLFTTASLMAVLVIVWGGYKYFFSGLEISKKDGMDNIKNGVIGLVTVILAEGIVKIIDASVLKTPAAGGGFLNINTASITGFIVSIVNGVLLPVSTAFTVFFVVMGGFYWTTSSDDSKRAEKAKKSVVNALIGLVIVILAVSFVQIVKYLVGGLSI